MLYATSSTLPWWAFFIACGLSCVCILFFGAQYAMTGYQYNTQPVIQMIGGYLHPGFPKANMFFVVFGYNSVWQGQLLLSDLKFGQYTHLSPRATFTAQMVSTYLPHGLKSLQSYTDGIRAEQLSEVFSHIFSCHQSLQTNAKFFSLSKAQTSGPAKVLKTITLKLLPGAV